MEWWADCATSYDGNRESADAVAAVQYNEPLFLLNPACSLPVDRP